MLQKCKHSWGVQAGQPAADRTGTGVTFQSQTHSHQLPLSKRGKGTGLYLPFSLIFCYPFSLLAQGAWEQAGGPRQGLGHWTGRRPSPDSTQGESRPFYSSELSSWEMCAALFRQNSRNIKIVSELEGTSDFMFNSLICRRRKRRC